MADPLPISPERADFLASHQSAPVAAPPVSAGRAAFLASHQAARNAAFRQGPVPPVSEEASPNPQYHEAAQAVGGAVQGVAGTKPLDTASAIASATGRTIDAVKAPVIAAVQDVGLRNEALKGSLYEDVRRAREAQNGPGVHIGAADLATSVLGDIAKSAYYRPGTPEYVARIPQRGGAPVDAANQMAELIHKDYPGFNAAQLLPKGIRENLLREAMLVGGFSKAPVEGVASAGSPEAMSLAADVGIGEGANRVPAMVKGAYGALPEEATGWLSTKFHNLTDAVRQAPIVSTVMKHVSQLGDMPTEIRQPMRQFNAERVGEKAATQSRLSALVEGDNKIIEEGARLHDMTPDERGHFLEAIHEKAGSNPATYPQYYDNLVKSDVITPDESAYLHDQGPVSEAKGISTLYEQAIPAERAAAGIRRHTLYESSNVAAQRALDAIHKVNELHGELQSMREGSYQGYSEWGQGSSSYGKVGMGYGAPGQVESTRRALSKAIENAYNQISAFSKVSKSPVTNMSIEPRNMYRYTADELLGRVNRAGDHIGPAVTRDEMLVPEKLPYRAVVRKEADSGLQGVRVFNKKGRQVFSSNAPTAIEDAKRLYAGELEVHADPTKRWGTTVQAEGAAQPVGGGPTGGPRNFNIGEMRGIGVQISDAQRRFARYLPRIRSEELQSTIDRLGLGAKYPGEGIGTGLGGPRATKPTTLTSEVAGNIRRDFATQHGIGVAEPLQDITQAARTAIRRTATITSNARFINKIADHFGTLVKEGDEVPDGMVLMGKARGMTAGMTKEQAAMIARTAVPADVMRAIKDINDVMSPKTRQGFFKFSHNLLQVEKQYLTTVNPQFSIRNNAYHALMTFIRGNRNPANWLDADRAFSGKLASKMVPGLDMTYGDLRRLAYRQGVIGDLGYSQELGSAPAKALAKGTALQRVGRAAQKPVEVMRQFNQEGAALARMSQFIYGMRDMGMTPQEARLEVAKVVFDYSRDFYTLSEAGLRELVPFYAWYRRIVPLMLRTAFEKPGAYIQLGSLADNINAMNGVSPEEVQYLGRAYMDAMGIVLPDSPNQPPGTKRVLNLRGVGLTDPATISRGADQNSWMGWLQGPAQGAAGLMRPEIGLVGSTLYEKQMGGRDYNDKEAKLPQIVGFIPEAARARMGIEQHGGQFTGPSYWIPMLSYLSGSAGSALASSFSGNKRARAAFQKWATAISIDPEVPFEENKTKEGMRTMGQMKETMKNRKSGAMLKARMDADSIMQNVPPDKLKLMQTMQMMRGVGR